MLGRLLTLAGILLLAIPSATHAQHHKQKQHAEQRADSLSPRRMPLEEPGHAIFGTVQEAIRALEADPDTDWEKVDLDRLRRHLPDMHQVATNVEVLDKKPIAHGVRLVVRPEKQAAGALARVLDAHPRMLQHDAGWKMDVQPQDERYVLRVTDPEGENTAQIRGLGYIGLLAYGPHHQHHHWMMVRGERAHTDHGTP